MASTGEVTRVQSQIWSVCVGVMEKVIKELANVVAQGTAGAGGTPQPRTTVSEDLSVCVACVCVCVCVCLPGCKARHSLHPASRLVWPPLCPSPLAQRPRGRIAPGIRAPRQRGISPLTAKMTASLRS